MSTPLNMRFDASQVAPAAPQELIPAGWYKARMSASEWTQSKSNDKNWFVQCKFTLIGEHDGSVLTDRINLANENVMAVEIGQRTLSAICHATGVMVVEDMAALHGIPLMIKVKVRQAGKGADGKDYEASNEISGYKALEMPGPGLAPGQFPQAPAPAAAPAPAPAAAAPAPSFAPPAAAAPAAAPGGGKPPWAK